ncbi:MAG: hypothetical protein L6R36_004128 [Xanthoria steineri]|nr:MAG: hypothetical protein L6R36_004128 [Xanthoria steineri]
MLALGTLDDAGRPWTTLLGGEAGFVRSLGQSVVGIKTLVDPLHDPVIDILLRDKHEGQTQKRENDHPIVAALGIDLATRSRVKLAGNLVAGLLRPTSTPLGGNSTEAQIVIKVVQSLGNCPKYLNKKEIVPTVPQPALVSSKVPLPVEAINLLARADVLFLSSSHGHLTMGTNNRGGSAGFCRVIKNDHTGTILVYPEYSGNRLYQTLGNLQTTPKAGIVVPDFDSGDMLHMTGTTEVLIGKAAADLLPRSNLVVKIQIEAARFIHNGLAFRGTSGEPSPYNPPVRFLAHEGSSGVDVQKVSDCTVYAKLIKKELLTPTIGRFRFSVSDLEAAGRWKPGQYVALSFEDELGAGYSHMRDDDPASLNDDLVRSFTVSSPRRGGTPEDEMEITIRNVGKVTAFLFRQNVRAGLEVPLKGFSGTFTIHQDKDDVVPFVAGGIGITPLLAQLPDLDLRRVRLIWTLNLTDVGLAIDTFERYPQLASSTTLYLSGAADGGQELQPALRLQQYGAQVCKRRLAISDLLSIQGQAALPSTTWYICAGAELRQTLLSWLSDRKVVYESFYY